MVLFVSFVFHAARKELKDNARAQERIVGEVLKALAIVDVRHDNAQLPLQLIMTGHLGCGTDHTVSALVECPIFRWSFACS